MRTLPIAERHLLFFCPKPASGHRSENQLDVRIDDVVSVLMQPGHATLWGRASSDTSSILLALSYRYARDGRLPVQISMRSLSDANEMEAGLLGARLISILRNLHEQIACLLVNFGGANRMADLCRGFDDLALWLDEQEKACFAVAAQKPAAGEGGFVAQFFRRRETEIPTQSAAPAPTALLSGFMTRMRAVLADAPAGELVLLVDDWEALPGAIEPAMRRGLLDELGSLPRVTVRIACSSAGRRATQREGRRFAVEMPGDGTLLLGPQAIEMGDPDLWVEFEDEASRLDEKTTRDAAPMAAEACRGAA